jgi:predicted O-methyltransferase YrrM
MEKYLSYLISKFPQYKKLEQQLAIERNKQGAFPAGHYYSPIPSRQDIMSYHRDKADLPELKDVHLNSEKQFKLLTNFSNYYQEISFPINKSDDYRYYFDNSWFSYSDAIFLYCFLRYFKPKKIIEIGSGFSSAVMLDTIERHYENKPELVLIEPFPERLENLLSEQDQIDNTMINEKLQSVDIDDILSLNNNDLLFIDSSHVLKFGSDLQKIMFEIIPRLKPGVHVHFHDIFYPFEYPDRWLQEGRYWNENYFLRTFLAYNSQWSINFFNHYVNLKFPEFIKEKMPLCCKNYGGSLYIQRNKNNKENIC